MGTDNPRESNDNPDQWPPRQVFLICHELIKRGYEDLRFLSYIKEGLGALRIFLYRELPERGSRGEALAESPFFHLSEFDGDIFHPQYPSELGRGEPDHELSKVDWFEAKYLHSRPKCSHPGGRRYLEWYEVAMTACGESGIPITGYPCDPVHEYDGRYIGIMRGDSTSLIPRPPDFGNTRFLVDEARALEALRLQQAEDEERIRRGLEKSRRRANSSRGKDSS